MKILVTGGTGLVGSAFKNIETNHELILVGSKDYNLIDKKSVFEMFSYYMPQSVIHLAAKVGGVKGNSEYVADYFYENILINTNVLNIAKHFKIKKVISLLSTCIYPDSPSYPLTEDQIHNGEPHPSNFGYAYAKRMLEIHSRAIRKQHKLKYITAIPNNIYGPNDNFDIENGHVIPSLIRKFHQNNNPVLWGDGSQMREFTYSKDVARSLLLLIENYEGTLPVNIGNTNEISISALSNLISKYFPNNKSIKWDITKPSGQHKKPSSNQMFMSMFPEFKYTSLEDGLKNTIHWYNTNYPNIRGI